MKQEFSLMEAAYNLLKAAEVNHNHLRDLIDKVDSSSSLLKAKAQSIDSTVSDAIDKSVNRSAAEISKKIIEDLSHANKLATAAAERLDEASKKSFKILLVTQITFLILSVFVLWFFFMRNIPTRQEFLEMMNASEQLHKYGYVYDCGDKKCVEIEGESGYFVKNTNAKLYNVRPR